MVAVAYWHGLPPFRGSRLLQLELVVGLAIGGSDLNWTLEFVCTPVANKQVLVSFLLLFCCTLFASATSSAAATAETTQSIGCSPNNAKKAAGSWLQPL